MAIPTSWRPIIEGWYNLRPIQPAQGQLQPRRVSPTRPPIPRTRSARMAFWEAIERPLNPFHDRRSVERWITKAQAAIAAYRGGTLAPCEPVQPTGFADGETLEQFYERILPQMERMTVSGSFATWRMAILCVNGGGNLGPATLGLNQDGGFAARATRGLDADDDGRRLISSHGGSVGGERVPLGSFCIGGHATASVRNFLSLGLIAAARRICERQVQIENGV